MFSLESVEFVLIKFHSEIQISKDHIVSWSVRVLSISHIPCYSPWLDLIEVIEVMPPALGIDIQLMFYLELSPYMFCSRLSQNEGRQLDCFDF